MNIKLKSEKNNTFAEGNNEERNDSMFQQEGDYIINKFPKYKYEIKKGQNKRNKWELLVPSQVFTDITKEISS